MGLDEATNDQRQIKKAYARKLKEIRPDEDAAGFMALRDAFERARDYAKYADDENGNIAFTDMIFEAVKDDSELEQIAIQSVVNVQISDEDYPLIEKPLGFEERMSTRIQEMLKNPWERSSKSAWDELFEDPELSSLDAEADFKNIMRGTLLSYFGYYDADGHEQNRPRGPKKVSSEVATFMFDKMGWHYPETLSFNQQHEIEWLRQELDVINRDKKPMTELYDDDDENESIFFGFFIVIGLYALYQLASVLFDK